MHPASSDLLERSADGNDRLHILVMNDEQALLDLFQDLLEAEGFRVTTSIYVLDAQKVRELAPDLMVLDMMFEGDRRGWPFITMTRLDPQLTHIPIVLCTAAVTTIETLRDRLAAQQVRVIYKPFQLDELLTAISEMRQVVLTSSD